MVSGWRVAAPEFSSTPAEMLSGEGAYRYGGRWNSKGTRVVYLGSSLAQASMELLVHLGRPDVLNSFYKLEVSYPEETILHIDINELPKGWDTPEMQSAAQRVGDGWVQAAESLVLCVPSVVVAGEYNFLLNPNHPDFSELLCSEVTLFRFDPRVLK